MKQKIDSSGRRCSILQSVLVLLVLHTVSSIMAAPADNLNLESWRSVNDGVMGGVSVGEMVAIEDGLRFQGDLSLENNGGFASVRRLFDKDIKNIRGIRLRVQGDGRQYQFRIRTDRNFDGVSWRHQFNTDTTWQTIELFFADFEPVFRGRKVRNAGTLESSRVRQIGFLLADGKPGKFQLDVTSIEIIEH